MELFDAQSSSTCKIITRTEIAKLKYLYKEQQKKIQYRLDLIQKGSNFGYRDGWDGYYPSKLIEIVNVETGFIKFLEPSINKIHEDSVFCVYIEGADTL